MARRTIIWTTAAVVALITLLLFGIAWKPKPFNDAVVVAFGDSITYGYGAGRGKDYASLLSQELGVSIINAGGIGDTTATALLRIERDILARRPDIVLVFLGGNDFLRGVPAFSAADNIKKIIEKIHAAGAEVVLVGVSYAFISDYERALERVAREMNVAGYVPNVLSGIILRPEFMADDIHPNDEGHKIIAQRIRPVLEKVLQER